MESVRKTQGRASKRPCRHRTSGFAFCKNASGASERSRGRTSPDEIAMATDSTLSLNMTHVWAMAEDIWAIAEGTLGPNAQLYGTVAIASILALPLLCCLRRGNNGRAAATKKAQKKSEAKPKEKPKKMPRVKYCKFCEVEILNKAFMASHLAGKKHKKLAGGATPEECWVWLEKPAPKSPEELAAEQAEAAAAEAARAAAEEAAKQAASDKSWVTVDAASKKKAARAAAAKRKADEQRQQPPPAEEARQTLRIHRRCNECGIRARDGATIETDPDDDTRAYCSDCWARYLGLGEEPSSQAVAAAPTPSAEPRRHVTKWNRDD